jgi:hypothetical protein
VKPLSNQNRCEVKPLSNQNRFESRYLPLKVALHQSALYRSRFHSRPLSITVFSNHIVCRLGQTGGRVTAATAKHAIRSPNI